MTFAELRSYVRLQLSEETEAWYENANIDTYLKIAIKRFVKKTKTVIFKQTITFLNGTSIYTLTNPILKIRGIVHSDPNKPPMKEVAYEDWKGLTDSEKFRENIFYIDNRTLEIHLPSQLENGTVELEYYGRATDTNAESLIDNSDIKDEYHEAISDYALYLAFKKDQEVSQANASLQSYLAWEREAIKETEMEEVNPILNDWDSGISNPHRNSTFIQDRTVL